MKQIYILFASILALGAISQTDCDYGVFEYDNGECKFDCEYKDNYISLDSVSFDLIKEECDDVRLANKLYPSLCNSKDDLVWRNNSCECPFCKCSSSSTDTIEIISYNTYGPEKECYEVECTLSTYESIKDMIFTSDSLDSADNPTEWEEYGTCPPNECTYSSISGDNYTVSSGEYWWADVGDQDTYCTEFCYCPSSGDTVCRKGWNNIMTNDGLKNAFIKECGGYDDAGACYNMESGSYDTSRLFTTDVGPSCYSNSCPKCDCGEYKFNDTWYVEYQDYWDLQDDYATCTQCICKRDYLDNLYADCGSSDSYNIGEATCNVDTGVDESNDESEYTCHIGGNNSGNVSSLTTTSCNYHDGEYCRWNYDPDDSQYYWDCGASAFCQAFADGVCTHTKMDLEYTDCDGNKVSDTIESYMECCEGSNCNHDISNYDTDQCTQTGEYEEMYSDYIDCIYKSGSAYYQYVCDDNVEEISCDALGKVFRQTAECQCESNAYVYERVSSTSIQKALKDEVDEIMQDYSEWNDVLGCNIELECDLTVPGGQVKGTSGAASGKSLFLAFICSFIVYITK